MKIMKKICIAAIFIVVFHMALTYFNGFDDDNMFAMAGVVATVAGILSGFYLAAITMLVGAVGNRVIKALKNNGLFEPLLHGMNVNCFSLVLVSILSLVSMIFVPSAVPVDIFFIGEVKLSVLLLSLTVTALVCLSASFASTWSKISKVVGAISKL
ncbi:hypothetical protein ACK3ZC_09505 [Aeromonas caviae]|uniref:hypothetical protein n=1 Tax=Aeromonas caviae TaxID=648 RepID=UPI002B46FDAE|nr:hypothetical protein [Aeromonas caviae]